MTFEQYLEGRNIFNSRDPQYDINLAGDMSDDEQDASRFLAPFAKKLKQFGWYCHTVGEAISAHTTPDESRNQSSDDIYVADRARRSALRNLVGDAHIVSRGGLKSFIERIGWKLNDAYTKVRYELKKSGNMDVWSLMNATEDINDAIRFIKDLEKTVSSGMSPEAEEVSGKFMPQFIRMASFLKAGLEQFKRIRNVPVKTPKNLIGLHGRRFN